MSDAETWIKENFPNAYAEGVFVLGDYRWRVYSARYSSIILGEADSAARAWEAARTWLQEHRAATSRPHPTPGACAVMDDESATCPTCHGTGTDPKWGECLLCAGHGEVHRDLATRVLQLQRDEIRCCPRCGGDGCQRCDKGYIPAPTPPPER